jgi:hypothetical protein
MSRRLIPLLAPLAAAVLAANAAASAGSAARSASFCSVSKGLAQQLVSTAKTLDSASSPAERVSELRKQFATIKRSEPALRSSVPGRLKPKLAAVLAFVDLVDARLSAVHWSLPALLRDKGALAAAEAASARADSASVPLRAYYRSTCKFPI